MKRRIGRLPLAAALLLALSLLLWLPASAAEVYFTAVNNTLLALEDENMPVNVNGTIYVPYTVFNSLELGTYAIYSYSSQTVVILQGELELYYDMSRGMTYDQDNTELAFKAVFRKGKVYVPAYATSQFFGLRYAYITDSAYGDIVRITAGNAMDDASFVRSAAATMQAYLTSYLRSATPTATQPAASATPLPSATPTPSYGDTEIYTAFFGLDPLAEQVMALFEQYDLRTCFFLTAADIMDNPDLVRQICGRGHSVGLLLGEPLEAQYAQASALLFEAAAYQTQLVALDGQATADSLSAAAGLGLNLWCDASTPRTAADALSSAPVGLDGQDRAVFLLELSQDTVDSLPRFLARLQTGRYSVLRLDACMPSRIEWEGEGIQ